jgi:hypothetical protein
VSGKFGPRFALEALGRLSSMLRRARTQQPTGEEPPSPARPAPAGADEPPHAKVIPREPDPAAQQVLERGPRAPELLVDAPPPAPEPVPPTAEVDASVPPEPAEDEPTRAQLAAVPESPPAPEPEPAPDVVPLPVPSTPREWNLWELERVARERPPEDQLRAEEQAYILVYLREFARPDGTLPLDFDTLVRESFGDLLEPARA